MKDIPIPWPEKGDDLFNGEGHRWEFACLNFTPYQWDLYADGYKRAADLLVEHVKHTGEDQDTLVYPIVFSYRQYLELRLKELIIGGSRLLGIPDEFPNTHNINKLWRLCRIILEKVWPEGPCEALCTVEECIDQFSKKDPWSTAFRYPTDVHGDPSLPGLREIDLANLSTVMDKISSLLEGSSTGIYENMEAKREGEQMAEDFRQEMAQDMAEDFREEMAE